MRSSLRRRAALLGYGGARPRAIYPIDDVGGTAPAFAYGVAKLTKTYGGPAIRVLRPSDSAEQDIGFTGAKLDMAAVSTFLGSEIGQVLKFYDQSGNGNDTDTQETSARRFTIRAPLAYDVLFNGQPTVYAPNATYELPADLSVSSRAFSHYAVLGPVNYDLSGIIELGASSPVYRQFLQTSPSGGYLFGTTPNIHIQSRPTVFEAHLSASATIQSAGDETWSGSAQTNNTLTGGRLGQPTSGYWYTGYAACWIGYARALSADERTAMKALLATLFDAAKVPGRLVFVGDSITSGGEIPARYNGFARQIIPLLSKAVPIYNLGAGGTTIATRLSNYATETGALLDAYSDLRIVFLNIGSNDITIDGRSAADIYADVQSYAALVRADGAKIIVSTQTPNSADDATERQTRADFNTLIRDNWASIADGFADFAVDPIMGQLNAPSPYYLDGLHPSELGYTYMTPIAAAAINPLLEAA